MKSIKLDFCIIESPIGRGRSPIIFVTRKGMGFLDESIINEEDYEKAIFLIQNIGYVESDLLTFEFSQDPDFPQIQKDSIIKLLEQKGMKYNSSLEQNLLEELKYVKQRFSEYLENHSGHYGSLTSLNTEKDEKMYLNVPAPGEKLTIFFNLFLECDFRSGLPYLMLNGNLTQSKSTDLRNFFRPVKSSFIRTTNNSEPNKIILKSTRTLGDFFHDLPINQSGAFIQTISQRINESEVKESKSSYNYTFMEVKNSLVRDSRIEIQIDSLKNFDALIKYSKITKKRKIAFENRKINVKKYVDKYTEIIDSIEQKMLVYANKEEYERALTSKVDLEYVKRKLELLNSLKKDEMTYKNYVKKFHIN